MNGIGTQWISIIWDKTGNVWDTIGEDTSEWNSHDTVGTRGIIPIQIQNSPMKVQMEASNI